MDDFSALRRLIHARRSIRQWLDEPVAREDLLRMLECARWAPSDTNAQPWHFTVITDRDVIRRLQQTTSAKILALAAEMTATGRRSAARKLAVFAKYAAHFGHAPALILVSGRPYDSRFMQEIFPEILCPAEMAALAREESVKSTSLASMNLLLAAHALGYGMVPMTAPVMLIADELLAQLDLPDGVQPHLLLALGRPAISQPPVVPRKEIAAIANWI